MGLSNYKIPKIIFMTSIFFLYFTACNVETTIRKIDKDTTAPTISIVSPVSGAYINQATDSATYSVSGTCNETGQTVTIKSDNVSVGSATCVGGVFASTNVNSTLLAAGNHSLTASISDAALNSTTSSAVIVIRDVVAPNAATSIGWTETSPATSTSVNAAWTVSTSTDLASQQIQFYADGTCSSTTGSLTTLASVATATYPFTGTSLNTYSYKITNVDLAGNSTTSACSSALLIDTSRIDLFVGTLESRGNMNGTLTNARYYNPTGITKVGSDFYITDQYSGTIRKISSGVVTTVVGQADVCGSANGTGTAATLCWPTGITSIGTDVYFAEYQNFTIRKYDTLTGVVTSVAGLAGTAGATDGTGTAARFNALLGMATDGTYLYAGDNGRIRKITTAGVVTTIAISPNVGSVADLTFMSNVLYIADAGKNQVLQMPLVAGVPGAISVLAGAGGPWGSDDGTGVAAKFYMPWGITNDGTNIYVSDVYNYTIRKITTAGVVTTIAGTLSANGGSYDNSTGLNARFNQVAGMYYSSGVIYLADMFNNAIRTMSTTAPYAVGTYSGVVSEGGYVNGIASVARFNGLTAFESIGTNLYVADSYNNAVRVIDSSGNVQLYAGQVGTPGDIDGDRLSTASFWKIVGLTAIGADLYVLDELNCNIRKISGTNVTKLAGTTFGSCGNVDGTGAAAQFDTPSGITTDGTYLYVADSGAGNVRKVNPTTGVVTTISTGLWGIRKITYTGGKLYMTGAYGDQLWFVTTAGGAVTTLAGSTTGFVNATGISAKFSDAQGIATDGTNLYVSDLGNNIIRKVVINTGVVSTYAGSQGVNGDVDGPLSSAGFSNANGTVIPIHYSSTTGFFVGSNNGVRKITP